MRCQQKKKRKVVDQEMKESHPHRPHRRVQEIDLKRMRKKRRPNEHKKKQEEAEQE